ncbi:cupin domain-containing protein [Allomuricauda sp. d1]|uniref:cupin domain-containing protein n=1 Tax=Allomuricauda sp. d1 TaxID=3136725 RepID=UPI0031DD37A3
MYSIKIDNTIANQSFDALQVKQLVKNNKLEILSISLAKGAIFPPHESHEDAHLVVLEGCIAFYIEESPIVLTEQQQFSFPKNKSHWVEACEDSKFLIIR